MTNPTPSELVEVHREADPDTPSKGARKRLRKMLFEKQRGRCAYCDEPMMLDSCGGRMASFDHIIPIARGGADLDDNLVLACWPCNRLKANMSPERLRRLADRIESLTGDHP